jgi:hypothetical protein
MPADMANFTARAFDRLGMAVFCDRPPDVEMTATPRVLAALVRHSGSAPPDLHNSRIEPAAPMVAYHQHFHRFDPFCGHRNECGERGVLRLPTVDQTTGTDLSAREFIPAMTGQTPAPA